MDRLAKLTNVAKEDSGYVLTIPSNVLFEGQKTALTVGVRTKLDEAAEVLSATGASTIDTHAFVDTKARASTQKPITEKRADAARSYLLQKGIAAGRMRALGFGLERPIADDGTADGWARNRRIEIVPPTPTTGSK